MTLLLKTNRFLVTIQFWGFISVETLRLCTNIQNQQERSCSVLIMSLSSAARWTGFFLKTLTIILLIPHILLQLVCQKFLKLSVFLFKLLRAFKWILETLFFLHFDYYCNATWIHSYVNFIWCRLRWHQTTFETHMQSDSKTSTCSPFCSLSPRSISQMFTSSSATLLLTSCPASLWSASLASWDFIWPKVTSEHKHSHLSSLTETGRVRGCRRADNDRNARVKVKLFSKTIEG